MKNSTVFAWLVLSLACLAAPSPVAAQIEAPIDVPREKTNTADAPGSIAQISRLCADGFYDEAIAHATQALDEAQAAEPPKKVDGMLLYWRGIAELRVGWFEMARGDMLAAVKAGVKVSGETPLSVLQKIENIEAVLPPQVFEVKSGENTIFRVYYTQNDPVSRAIIETLPAAYRISADLFGADLMEQPVFIFNTFAQMIAFMEARGAKRATSWGWAYGSRDAFYFCLENPQGRPTASFQESYIRSTVAHEYNHALFQRAMGNVVVPNWFLEGIASLAGTRLSREAEAQNDLKIARLMAIGALVPPQNLETSNAFIDHTEVGQTMQRAGLGKIAVDPYAQGLSMTRFLVANMGAGELPVFLNQVREAKSFERGLQAQFGLTLPQFYERWYLTLRQRM